MRKSLLCIILTIAITTSLITPVAANGECVGTCIYASVVTYINNCPIKSYNMNGLYTFVAVEDLTEYGFDVLWDPYRFTLRLFRNYEKGPFWGTGSDVERDNPKSSGVEKFKMYKTNVRTYIGDYSYEIECLGGIPGKTLINVDNLAAFGTLQWDSNKGNILINLDGSYCYSTLSDVPTSKIILPFTIDGAIESMRMYLSGVNPGLPYNPAALFTPIAYEYGIDEKGEYYLIQCESWATDQHYFKVYYDGTIKESSFILPE